MRRPREPNSSAVTSFPARRYVYPKLTSPQRDTNRDATHLGEEQVRTGDKDGRCTHDALEVLPQSTMRRMHDVRVGVEAGAIMSATTAAKTASQHVSLVTPAPRKGARNQ